MITIIMLPEISTEAPLWLVYCALTILRTMIAVTYILNTKLEVPVLVRQ
jgi:hypothetical protein